MHVLLTPKHIRFVSLVLGLLVFIIIVLFLLPGCAPGPGMQASTLEQEVARPPVGWVAHVPEAVRR